MVTGGARGIGFATVQRLLREGARCVIWDRDQAAIDAATANLADAGEVTSDTVELAKPESVEAAAGQALGRHGQIDILVNNAGIAGINKKLWECTPQEWRDVMEIDLFGVFLCCRAFVPGMIEAGWGRIVNVASIAGKEGNPTASHYSAAKAGVIGLTKALARELAPSGVLVNAIAPGYFKTAINDEFLDSEAGQRMAKRVPMRRFGNYDELTGPLLLLASEQGSYMTGSTLIVDGGHTLTPL